MTTHFRVWGVTGSLTTERPDQLPFATQRLWYWLDAIDAAANRFRSDTEISLVNDAGGQTIAVSPVFATLLEGALTAARVTDGLCTPTVLNALLALGYDHDFDTLAHRVRPAPTAPPMPAPALSAIDFDATARTLRLAPGCRLDLGASAKAMAADLIADDVAPSGGVVVEIGGDVAVRGASANGPWAIGVSDALVLTGEEPRVAFGHGGIATSSTRVRRWRLGEREVHHVLDPRTGSPAHGPVETATVAAASCLLANAFATAALCWDQPGYHVAQAGWSARLVRRDGSLEFVGGWPAERGVA